MTNDAYNRNIKHKPAAYTSRSTAAPSRDAVGDVLTSIGKSIAASRKKNAAREDAMNDYVVVRSKKRAALPVKTLAWIAVCTVVAAFLVTGNMRINEANMAISDLKNNITEAQNTHDELGRRMDGRYDASYIEYYAENVLGMVKENPADRVYVSISSADLAEAR